MVMSRALNRPNKATVLNWFIRQLSFSGIGSNNFLSQQGC
jgi:hypothetical protein